MPAFFVPESPLGLLVQQVLLTAPEALTVAEIRRTLRINHGRSIAESNLRELLSHPQVFTSISGDRYCMRSDLSTGDDVNSHAIDPVEDINSPWIENIWAAQRDFVVLDLETTGLDLQRDTVIQIAAIRFRSGEPVAYYHQFVNPSPRRIPQTVKAKLKLDRRPDVLAQIASGPALEEIADEIRAFLGDDAIVAHNARFDVGMLTAALGALPNVGIDTMELAMLVVPQLPNHRLETLRDHLGITDKEIGELWSVVDNASPIDPTMLHDASTDVALLGLVYRRLLTVWHHTSDPSIAIARELLPEMDHARWEGTSPDVRGWLLGRDRPVVANDAVISAPPILPVNLTETMVMDALDLYRSDQGYEERPGQTEMAVHVARALREERRALIEAPTGTGKTVAYLIPAVLHAVTTGGRIAISTPYRNLQDQLLGELERVRRISMLDVRHVMLKGANSYLCLDLLASQFDELGVKTPLDERFALAYLVRLLATNPDATRDDINYWSRQTFPVMRSIEQAIAADGSGCVSARCKELGCLLARVTIAAPGAHVLVVNHALWLAEPDRLPPTAVVIIDEAHTLEDAATAAWITEVSRTTLEASLDQLIDRRTSRGILPRVQSLLGRQEVLDAVRQCYAAINRFRTLNDDFGRHLERYVRSRENRIDPRYGASMRLEGSPLRTDRVRWTPVEHARTQLFDLHLRDVLNRLSNLLALLRDNRGPDLQPVIGSLERSIETLTDQRESQEQIVRVGNRGNVYWIEVDSPDARGHEAAPIVEWALKSAPVRVDEVLRRRYAELSSVVLVSATLTVRGGDFSFFVERLGLSDTLRPDDQLVVAGDLNYAANAFLGMANYLEYTPVERTMASFTEELADELALLLDFTDGRALGLFTSRERMEAVNARCEPHLADLGIPVYLQSRDSSRRQLQADFQEHTESVLFGLRSFWEGVDVPGESLSFVIMEKLPFPFVFDPIFKARREEILQRGKHEFDDYLFPLMALQFKQGFGRLLRRKSDRGAVLLMDRRIHRKSYKPELLASLPGYMPRDEQAERSRRSFYEAMANALPGLVDLEAKERLLASLPEQLTIDLVDRLGALAIPDRIAEENYDQWRPMLLTALKEVFGFDGFRSPEQEAVVRAVLTGRDVLALLPTGAGKSLCFQLPALLRDGVTLVFSPLIALMRDQVQALTGRGIEIVGAIYSGQPADEREETLRRIQTNRVRLVYIAPERIRDPQLLRAIENARVVQVVVDEAHCVAMWGPSFRPDFLYLPRLFSTTGHRSPVAAFTATATPPMRTEIIDSLELRDPVQVITSFDRPNLNFVVYNATSRYNPIRSNPDRFRVLMRVLQAADQERDSVLIYVTTTVEAELLAHRLRAAGYDARSYHGKMTTAERHSVQELFMDDHVNIVVCTRAFGMGIDKPDVRYVIHYDMPGDLESYYQEAGRAGRDGKPAWCVLLFHPSARGVHDYFIDAGRPDTEILNDVADALRSMPGERVYLDPLKLMETLGIDETQLRIALHLLEHAGLIARGPDFALHASLTLLDDREHVARALEGVERELFERASQLLGWPVFRRINVDLLDAAGQLAVSPNMLDDLLVRLALSGQVLYRAWERGNLIDLQAGLHSRHSVSAVAETDAHLRRLQDKLDTMIAYAEQTNECRRSIILRYFGETTAPMTCANCDACEPDTRYPWSLLTARDTASVADFYDPAFTLLELAKWNLDQTKAGHNPLGTGALIHILTGNSYALSRHQTDPILRSWRLRRLRGCPWWGVFDMLPSRDRVIDACLTRLTAEGFVAETSATFMAESGAHTYSFLDLTAKGRDQLLRGELLNW